MGTNPTDEDQRGQNLVVSPWSAGEWGWTGGGGRGHPMGGESGHKCGDRSWGGGDRTGNTIVL